MRWLADENIPRGMIACLRELGEDVASIAEGSPGVPDRDVIAYARTEQRLLLSFDRDHGDLIFRSEVAPPPGVVYLRLNPPDPERLHLLAAALVDLGADSLLGYFTVVSRDVVRKRALPAVPR